MMRASFLHCLPYIFVSVVRIADVTGGLRRFGGVSAL
jgi:hypothetical protein